MRVGWGVFGSRMGRGMGRWKVDASKRLDWVGGEKRKHEGDEKRDWIKMGR